MIFLRPVKGLPKIQKSKFGGDGLCFVPDSKMLQIIFFCPRLKNATNYNAFFVPDSKMLQITTLFCWTRLKKKKIDFDTVRN